MSFKNRAFVDRLQECARCQYEKSTVEALLNFFDKIGYSAAYAATDSVCKMPRVPHNIVGAIREAHYAIKNKSEGAYQTWKPQESEAEKENIVSLVEHGYLMAIIAECLRWKSLGIINPNKRAPDEVLFDDPEYSRKVGNGRGEKYLQEFYELLVSERQKRSGGKTGSIGMFEGVL